MEPAGLHMQACKSHKIDTTNYQNDILKKNSLLDATSSESPNSASKDACTDTSEKTLDELLSDSLRGDRTKKTKKKKKKKTSEGATAMPGVVDNLEQVDKEYNDRIKKFQIIDAVEPDNLDNLSEFSYVSLSSLSELSKSIGDGSNEKSQDDIVHYLCNSSQASSVARFDDNCLKNGKKNDVDPKNMNPKQFENKVRLQHTQACKAMGNGHYRASLQLFESILKDVLLRFGGNHKRVGAALHNVAIANLRAGNLSLAKEAIEEAIKIRSRTLGKNETKLEEITDSLVEYGIILATLKEFGDALKIFEGCLLMRKNELALVIKKTNSMNGKKQDDLKVKIAKLYNNVGCVYLDNDDYDAATLYFDQANIVFGSIYSVLTLMFQKLSQMISLFSTGDKFDTGYIAMACTLCNRAYVELKRMDYAEAMPYLKESLDIQKEILPTKNKMITNTLKHLAYAHLMLNDKESALTVYLDLWRSQKDSVSSTTEERITTLRTLIYCYALNLDFEKALKYLGYLEDLLVENPIDKDEILLGQVKQLLQETTYQIYKFPSCTNACTLCQVLDEDEVHLESWKPLQPKLNSMLSMWPPILDDE